MTERHPQWFVAQAVRNREIAASLSVVRHGFEAYVPIIHKQRKIGRVLVDVDAPRFGTYIFVRFDRFQDPWPNLCREPPHWRRYFDRVLCDLNGLPSPVPDIVMEAIRAYEPPRQEAKMPHVYTPGERVTCWIAGVRKEAVFVGYQGHRKFVRTWIFGSEHTAEVKEAELEPLDLDSCSPLTTNAAQ